MEKAPGVALGQFHQRGRRREEVGHGADRSGQRHAGGVHQSPGHRTRAGDRDLLADDGAHGELEAVGGTRHAAPGTAPHQAADERVVAQGLPDGDGIGIEVEQLAAAGHGRVQVAQVFQHELALHVGGAAAAAAAAAGAGAGAGSSLSGARSVTMPCPWGRRRLRR